MSQLSAVFELLKSFQGLIIPFAPFIITKGYNIYQKRKNARSKPFLEVSTTNWTIISILATVAFLQVIFYIPYAWPAINVFSATNSRMQTPGDVIGSRLRALFGDEYETAPRSMTSGKGNLDYELLVSRLASSDGKALYAVYGTEAYAGCQWCRTDQPFSFFLYILPSIVIPHALNFFPILLVTTGNRDAFALSSASSRQWFRMAVIFGMAFLGIELYTMYQAPNVPEFLLSINNSVSHEDVPWIFWSRIKMRAWAFAVADSVLAFLVFLSASGRAFETGEATAVRTSRIIKQLDGAVNKLRLSILLHTNVIARNQEMRNAYVNWGANAEYLDSLIRSHPSITEARKEAKARVLPGFSQLETNTTTFVENNFQSSA